jgi:hypothetical protein
LEHAEAWRAANTKAQALTGADDVVNRVVLRLKAEGKQKQETELKEGHYERRLVEDLDPPALFL